EEVDESPRKPGRESAHLDDAGIHNGKAPSYHRHVAFVEITERRRRRTSSHSIADHFTDKATLLHGHLRNPRQRLAVLIERGGVADDEDLGMARHAAIPLDPHTSGPVGRRIQPFARGRRRDPGSPDNAAAWNSLVAYDYRFFVNRLDGLSGTHLHAHALKTRLCFPREFFGKSGEDARTRLGKEDARLLMIDEEVHDHSTVLGLCCEL